MAGVDDQPVKRSRAMDVAKLAVVLTCWVVGIVLRLQPMPAKVAGGGLLVIGVLLLAYWARRRPSRRVS
jgi:uncharacterized membrane protein